MRFASLVEKIAGEGADAWDVHSAARAAQERGEDVILLSVGDPDLDTPEPVVQRAIDCLRAGDTHYTPVTGRDALRAAIAELHRSRTGQLVDARHVAFLAGAQNALFCAALCLAGPGDEIIAIEPLYPTYPATLQASGARLVRAAAPPAAGFRVDAAVLESRVTSRTRAIFLASPNNPSGVILSAAELAGIGEVARRHGLWVVVDEVYAGLAPGGRVPSLASSLPDQVVTVGSLSKSHAMAGWRAGWLIAPPAMIEHIERLALCMLYGLPGFIQEAALAALAVAPTAEARIRDYCALRRDAMLQGLAGVPGIRCHVPDAGMFMLVDVRGTGLSGHDFMTELYRSEGVALLDGGAFGRETRAFVRVCFATDIALLREACVRIARFVRATRASEVSHV